jgi:hypothetical protein
MAYLAGRVASARPPHATKEQHKIMKSLSLTTILALLACLSFTPVLGAAEATGERIADGIRIEAPYARAVPPGQPNSAVFMVLENTGDTPRALVGAESDIAATLELHTHRMADGMMQMRKIERIDLPAGERVSLAPGGLHLMLIGLREQLRPGAAVSVTLIFDDGSRTEFSAPVRQVTPMQEHVGH